MNKLPFTVPENIDIEKDLVTNPYHAKYHLGTDYRTSHRVALFARTDGIVNALEGNIASKAKGKKQWIANTKSDPFLISAGKIIYERSLRNEDYGNFVKIYHGKNARGESVETLVSHLDEVVVFKGQAVVKGQLIGYSDSTGNSTGNHVHDEIRVNGRVVNPATLDFSFEGTTGNGVSAIFFPYVGKVDIRGDIDGVRVRSGPGSSMPLSGSKFLAPNTKGIGVRGYVEGEEVSAKINGEDVVSKYWWVSQFGNYFWCGATVQKPLLDQKIESDTIEESDSSNLIVKGSKMTIEERQKIEAKIVDVDKRLAELAEETKTVEASKVELEAKLQEPVEEVKEEVVETPAEEAVVAEAVAEEKPAVSEAEKAEAISLIEQIKAKFGL